MKNTKEYIVKILDETGIFVPYDYKDDIDLREYNIDSISFISFVVNVEEAFGISIPDEALLIDTLSSLNGFINMVDALIEIEESHPSK